MLESHRHGSICELRLNRPPANALTTGVLNALADHIDHAVADGAGAIVLSAEGKTFCAGLDLREVPGLDRPGQNDLLAALNRAIGALYGCPLPTVVAVNGHSIAGGFVLPLCCDVRLRAKGAYLVGLTEVVVGVPYPIAAIEVVRAELDADSCRRLVLHGETQDVGELAGVYDEVVDADALREGALARAEALAAHPKETYAAIKAQTRRTTLEVIHDAIANGDPLVDRWLSDETIERAQRQLDSRKG